MNLFNSDDGGGLQGLGLIMGALSNRPGQFENLFNTTLMMDERDRVQRKEQAQEAAAQSYLNNMNAVGSPEYKQRTFTPNPEDAAQGVQPMTIGHNAPAQNLLSSSSMDSTLAKAVGPLDYLKMKISQATPKYENVADVGLVNVNAPGGPRVAVAAGPKLSDYAKDLIAGGIKLDSPEGMQAMADHRKKQDYVPDLDPLNRSAKEAGMWVESKDAFGNPILVNKLTSQTKTPSGTQGVGEDDVASTANMIANYRKRPPTGNAGRSPFWISVMDQVQKINPEYNEQFYNSSNAARTKFSSGKEGTLVRSANVAVSHLETLKALGDALANGDTKAYNAIKNHLSDQLGGVPIAGYEAAAPLVGDEVAKFVLGGNSAVADREKFASPLASARSGPQRQAAINSFQGLLVGQLHGLRRQYEAETKSKDFTDKLDPEVAALLNNPQFAPGNNPNLPQIPQQPAQAVASAPPEGATATNKQTGQRLVYRQGQWVPVQ